jgi:hypothetical protein
MINSLNIKFVTVIEKRDEYFGGAVRMRIFD